MSMQQHPGTHPLTHPAASDAPLHVVWSHVPTQDAGLLAQVLAHQDAAEADLEETDDGMGAELMCSRWGSSQLYTSQHTPDCAPLQTSSTCCPHKHTSDARREPLPWPSPTTH